MNPYIYTPEVSKCRTDIIETTGKYSRYRVEFSSACPGGLTETDNFKGFYYQPAGVSNIPLIILLHGVGDQSIIPLNFLARKFACQGIASFILYLPVHSRRLTAEMKIRFPVFTADEWYELYRTSVINMRQVLDWASTRPEIDTGYTAVLGISFGGFISAIAMALENRIQAGVFIVSAGNGEKIGYLSRRWNSHRPEAEYRRSQEVYHEYLKEVSTLGFKNVTAPVKNFLTDPLTFASRLRRRPVLMLNARWDEVIPREAVGEFWEACGKPELAWFPATHASIWFWYPLLANRIDRFLKRVFWS